MTIEDFRGDNLGLGLARNYAKYNIYSNDTVFSELLSMKTEDLARAFRTGQYKGMSLAGFNETLYERAEEAIKYLDGGQSHGLSQAALDRLQATISPDSILGYDDFMSKIHAFTQGGTGPIVAHNLSGAEYPWIKQFLKASGLSNKKQNDMIQAFRSGIDSLFIARGALPELISRELGSTHLASDDITAVTQLFDRVLNKPIGDKTGYEHYFKFTSPIQIGTVLAKASTSDSDMYRGFDISKGMYIITDIQDAVKIAKAKLNDGSIQETKIPQVELLLAPFDISKGAIGEARRISVANKEQFMFELNANMRQLGNIDYTPGMDAVDIINQLPGLSGSFDSMVNNDIERVLHNAARGGFDVTSLYVQQGAGDNVYENMLWQLRGALGDDQADLTQPLQEITGGGYKYTGGRPGQDFLAVALENLDELVGEKFIKNITYAKKNRSDLYRESKDIIQQWAFGGNINTRHKFTQEFESIFDLMRRTKALANRGYISREEMSGLNIQLMDMLTSYKKSKGLTKTIQDSYTFAVNSVDKSGAAQVHNLRLDISGMADITRDISNMARTMNKTMKKGSDSLHAYILPQMQAALEASGIRLPMNAGELGYNLSQEILPKAKYNLANQMAEFLLASKEALGKIADTDKLARSTVVDMTKHLNDADLMEYSQKAWGLYDKYVADLTGSLFKDPSSPEAARARAALLDEIELSVRLSKNTESAIREGVAAAANQSKDDLTLGLSSFLKSDSALTSANSNDIINAIEFNPVLDERIRLGQSVYYNAPDNLRAYLANPRLQFMLPNEIVQEANKYGRYTNLGQEKGLARRMKAALEGGPSAAGNTAEMAALQDVSQYPELSQLLNSDLFLKRNVHPNLSTEQANQRIIDAAVDIRRRAMQSASQSGRMASMYYREIRNRATINKLDPFNMLSSDGFKLGLETETEYLDRLAQDAGFGLLNSADMRYRKGLSAEQLRAMKALNWIGSFDNPSFVFDPKSYGLSVNAIQSNREALLNKTFTSGDYSSLINSYDKLVGSMDDIILASGSIGKGAGYVSTAGRPLGSLNLEQINELLSPDSKKYLSIEGDLLEFYKTAKANRAEMLALYGPDAGAKWQDIFNQNVAAAEARFMQSQMLSGMTDADNLVYSTLNSDIKNIIAKHSAVAISPAEGFARGFAGDNAIDAANALIEPARASGAALKQTLNNIAIDPMVRKTALGIGLSAGALAVAGLLLTRRTAKPDRHTPESVKRGDDTPRPDGTYEDRYDGIRHETLAPGTVERGYAPPAGQTIRMEPNDTGMNVSIKARSKHISNKSNIDSLLSSAFEDSTVRSNININHTDDRHTMNRDYVSNLFSRAIAGN